MPITPDNFTALNTSDWGVWITAINALSGNWIGAVILLVVFMGTLVTLKTQPFNRTCDAFAASAFVTWVLATILLVIPMISWTLWAVSMSLLILGGIWVWNEG